MQHVHYLLLSTIASTFSFSQAIHHFFLGFCTFYINPHLFSLKLMSTSSLHYPFCPALMAFSSSLPSSMKRSATSMFALETLKRELLFIAHQSSSYITAH